jgi:hypothetical protein
MYRSRYRYRYRYRERFRERERYRERERERISRSDTLQHTQEAYSLFCQDKVSFMRGRRR